MGKEGEVSLDDPRDTFSGEKPADSVKQPCVWPRSSPAQTRRTERRGRTARHRAGRWGTAEEAGQRRMPPRHRSSPAQTTVTDACVD